MKVSDLRIGNLVYDNRVIKQLSEEDSDRSVINWGHYLYYSPFNLTPIPLTEEWLFKFGFNGTDYKHYTYILSSGNFISHEQNNISIIAKNIKYVHQLQNLYFSLTGEELALK